MKDKPREHRGKKHAVPESRFSWWRHITWWRHMLYLAFFVVGASCATYYSAWDSISKSTTSGKAGGLKKVEPLKAVRCCEPLKAVRL
jgi:hypothetical protein